VVTPAAVDRDLDIVADADLRMGGHRPAVGIGQRNLALSGAAQQPDQLDVAIAFGFQTRFKYP
jgi:hypothetical protein